MNNSPINIKQMIINSIEKQKLTITLILFFIVATSINGQKWECPLSKYDGNWAYGTTESFYVGEPFDGIGQVEVMRPGKRAEIHEKNRKWTINGKPIKPGEVFTQTGDFKMTIESDGYKAEYNIYVHPARGPKRPVATVVSYPSQTEYKVGDHFYVDGYKVTAHDENGKEVPVEGNDVTFFTSLSNTMIGVGSQCGGGLKFTIPGKKVVEVRYKYATIGKFKINVTDSAPKKTTPTPVFSKSITTGWYNMRAMNNYLNLDGAGSAELRKKVSNQKFYVEYKNNNQVTIKMSNGKYLGISETIKDGVRVKSVNTPYLWNIYSENNNDIFSLRPSSNLKMVVNASGQKNNDGTHVILWSHPDLNAPNHAEFRFIPTNK
jgi:hypothetical protein